MSAEVYTKAQVDGIATVIGDRIKNRTNETHIIGVISSANDANVITDAERAAIATIEPSKFLGQFPDLAALNTAHQATGAPGQYATLVNTGSDDTEAIWDADAGAFIDSGAAVTGETAASVKTKYESNANTNAFTDAEKSKLAALSVAAAITDFTSALDAALA